MRDKQTAAEQDGALPNEPRGLGEHARGLAGEYAHEQGWGLNEAERTRQPAEKQPFDGGKGYEYGARDFGDTPLDTASIRPSAEAQKTLDRGPDQILDRKTKQGETA